MNTSDNLTYAKVFQADKKMSHLWMQSTSYSLLNRPIVPCIPIMNLSESTEQNEVARFAVFNFLTRALGLKVKSAEVKELGVYQEGNSTYYYFYVISDSVPNPRTEAFKGVWKSVLPPKFPFYRPYQVGSSLSSRIGVEVMDLTESDKKAFAELLKRRVKYDSHDNLS